jgi:hypothetical protein
MCSGLALAESELPRELAAATPELQGRIHHRGGEAEFRFLYRQKRPLLPVWHEGVLRIVRWGNREGESRFLPPTGWTWLATVEEGGWRNAKAEPVDVPASLGLERGVWYRIRQGIRALLVHDEHGRQAAYMICEPASHYYRIMTRSSRMPVLIEEKI